jgi:protein-S-isoprenylcysteine O-methyltransferase Ste14
LAADYSGSAALRTRRQPDIDRRYDAASFAFEIRQSMTASVALTVTGALAAVALISLLLAGLTKPAWRIWPAPPAGSARSLAFWTLFRILNVVTLILAALRAPVVIENAAARPLHALLLTASAGAFVVYGFALWALGRTGTYCRASGLQTRGIYQWARNPQYTAAMVAFSLLAVAVNDMSVAALTAALVLAYGLMALNEEPWLEAAYGKEYRAYRRRVPRFFNWLRLIGLLRIGARIATRSARGNPI